MNATLNPSCPHCGQPPEQKIREYIPAGTNRLTGIYYCSCGTMYPFPPVHPPSEDDGADLDPPPPAAVADKPSRKSKTAAKLDLTSKRDVFLSLIKSGLAKCTKTKMLPITRLDVVFNLFSASIPQVWIQLDTHPAGEPVSGTSKTYLIVDKTVREWAPQCHAACGGETVTVISKAGVTEVFDEATLCRAVGQFFIEIITSLRDSGELRGLPRGAACYLGVGAYDGVFGWPAYEERGPANMF